MGVRVTTSRVPDWPARLAAEIERARGMPFAWGTHDCCLWVARVVEQIIGRDFAADYRGYRTERGALRVLARHGGPEGIATTALGPAMAPRLAIRGDVVSFLARRVAGPVAPALGIVLGARFAAVSPAGLIFPAMEAARSAWAVGHG